MQPAQHRQRANDERSKVQSQAHDAVTQAASSNVSNTAVKQANKDNSSSNHNAKLTEEEHREHGTVASKVYGSYFKALGVLPITIVLLALAAGQIAWIMSEWWLAQWAAASADS